MRVLILSDIHGNLEALEAVLAAAGEFNQLWNLGDVVGYGASPNQVLERLRPLANLNVRGNHDRVCCGLTPALNFNPIARTAAQWTYSELIPDNLQWLRELPQGPLYPELSGIGCVHGSPLHEDDYIVDIRDALKPIQQTSTGITFFGHTHIQGGFVQNGSILHPIPLRFTSATGSVSWILTPQPDLRYLINPGSIGQPRDADWRAAYILYDTEANTITFHRVPYDVHTAQNRILAAGLPERLAGRLREGR